jgi:hypothetical protein
LREVATLARCCDLKDSPRFFTTTFQYSPLCHVFCPRLRLQLTGGALACPFSSPHSAAVCSDAETVAMSAHCGGGKSGRDPRIPAGCCIGCSEDKELDWVSVYACSSHALKISMASEGAATQRLDARRPPTVPSLNLASVRYASSDENRPPPLARGSTPLQPRHPPAVAAAVAAAAARGLDSALLSSWGVQSEFVSATPTPPPKAFAGAAEGGLSSRRVHLSGTGSTPSSSNAVLDLTHAVATPLHAAACSATLQAIPAADMDELAHLIGLATHRSHHARPHSNKKQRLQKGQSKRGHDTDRSGAKTSSLLPQFTKGFSLYMKRWNPTYYFGQPVESPVAPAAATGTQKPQPQPPKLKPGITAAAHQSPWAAAAEAAKTKIAMIEEEHARRRGSVCVTEPKIMQVITASLFT